MINEKVWIINKKFLVITFTLLVFIISSVIFFLMKSSVDKSTPVYLENGGKKVVLCTE